MWDFTVFPFDRQVVLVVNTGNWQHYSKLLQQHWDPDTYYRSMLSVAATLSAMRGRQPLIWLGVPSTFDEKFRTRPLAKRPATISRKLWWSDLTWAAAHAHGIEYIDIQKITMSRGDCVTSDRTHFNPEMNTVILDIAFMSAEKQSLVQAKRT